MVVWHSPCESRASSAHYFVTSVTTKILASLIRVWILVFVGLEIYLLRAIMRKSKKAVT
jgi:hypothetical protein